MKTEVATIDSAVKAIEKVLIGGDLSSLTAEQKISYYNKVCESLSLNPLTQPFAFIKLNGKEVLYATRACTEQLRTIHNVSLQIVARESLEGVYVVTARAILPNGRQDESTGAVAISGLKGDNLANAYLKCETKAKRRVTLSICGLGLLDETEVATIHTAEVVHPKVEASFVPPPVTPTMKALFEKNEAAAVKEEMSKRLYHHDDLATEGFSTAHSEALYVMFGKNKGMTFAEVGKEGLAKSVWGAEKGLSEGSEWVDKVGVSNVELFIKQAKEYINNA